MTSKLARIPDIFRKFGFGWALLFFADRALRKLSCGRIGIFAYHLVAQPVHERPMLPPRRGKSIDVREIGVDEAVTLPVARPREVLIERYHRGARCLMASTGGRFAGFLWFQTDPYEEDEVRCRFVPGPTGRASWDFDVFVAPSARLSFTFMRLWDEANRILSSSGVRWSISRISVFNHESISAHAGFGLVRLASAVFLCVGSWQLTIATVKPYAHWSFGPRSRPVLELRGE